MRSRQDGASATSLSCKGSAVVAAISVRVVSEILGRNCLKSVEK